ncbi:MAG: SH3 domain-containing protein [Clostridia bacterium]|nr:SH3 domain-containing protein [Clostridia bacterium]
MKKLLATLMILCIFAVQLLPVSAYAASASNAGKVTTSSTSLNVRSTPATTSSVIGSLKRNTYVTLISKTGNWWYVEFADGKKGYCHSNYITQVDSTAGYVKLTSGYLNVRSGAGTSYSAKDRLYNGEKVYILTDYGNWVKILFDGNETGYVNKSYISATAGNSSSSGKKLSVPYYSQTDSRWKNVTLGSSGKTLGSIGCTTTCLAMTESYRRGTTVRPDTMASSLSYSSSGSLYWPSNYTTTTSVSFSAIKNILNQGKPVILGLRTASYSTHWVVVTGYSGNTYYVNDPGSSSRTTLGSVFEKYPYFYKMAYYK